MIRSLAGVKGDVDGPGDNGGVPGGVLDSVDSAGPADPAASGFKGVEGFAAGRHKYWSSGSRRHLSMEYFNHCR